MSMGLSASFSGLKISAKVKYFIFSAGIALTLLFQAMTLFSWPFHIVPSDTPVFRHFDELLWAIRLGSLWDNPAEVAPWPIAGGHPDFWANPHVMYSSWPAVRVGKFFGCSRQQIYDFVRLFSQLTLFGASLLVVRSVLRKHNFDWATLALGTCFWGGYLALDPGLAIMKPIASNVIGNTSGFMIAFDRIVSPSCDIVLFALATAAFLSMVNRFPMRWPQALIIGAALTLLNFLPPYYLLTAIIFFPVILAVRLSQRTYRDSIRSAGFRSMVALIVGVLPGIVIVALRAHALLTLPDLQAMQIRTNLLPSSTWDFGIFARTITCLTGLSLAVFALVLLWRKKRELPATLFLSIGWLLLAFITLNQHMLTGKEVQSFHLEWPCGFLLGVGIIIAVSEALGPRSMLLLGLIAMITAFGVRTAESSQTRKKFESWLSSDSSHVEIRPETLSKAKYLAEDIAESHHGSSVFLGPEEISPAIEYWTGLRPLKSHLIGIYPYSDAEIYSRFLWEAQLTGRPLTNVFKHVPASVVGSAWPYGLPASISRPPNWYAKQRESVYSALLKQASVDVTNRYQGPLEVLVIDKTPSGGYTYHVFGGR